MTKIRIALAILMLGWLVPDVFAAGKPISELITYSYSMETIRDYGSATLAMEEALGQYPEDYFINLRLGWLNYLSGKYAASIQFYQKTLALYPNDPAAMIGLASVYFSLEDYENAKNYYLQAFYLYPEDLNINLGLGWSYLYLGEKEWAEKCFSYVLAYLPDNPSALQGREALKKDYYFNCLVSGGYLVYQNHSQKSNMYSWALTPSIARGKFAVSPGYNYTQVNRAGTGEATRQSEIILGWRYKFNKDFSLNGFGDFIFNNDPATNNGRVLAGELLYDKKHGFYFGLGGAFSLYKDINALQFTPRLGWGITPNIWNEIKYDIISLSGGASPSQGRYSAWQEKLTFYLIPGFTFSVAGWTGEKYFPVEIGASMVYDFPDKLKRGYTFVFDYSLGKGGVLSGSVAREELEESSGNPYSYLSAILGYNYSW